MEGRGWSLLFLSCALAATLLSNKMMMKEEDERNIPAGSIRTINHELTVSFCFPPRAARHQACWLEATCADAADAAGDDVGCGGCGGGGAQTGLRPHLPGPGGDWLRTLYQQTHKSATAAQCVCVCVGWDELMIWRMCASMYVCVLLYLCELWGIIHSSQAQSLSGLINLSINSGHHHHHHREFH